MENVIPLKVTLNPYPAPKKTSHEKTISECIAELSSSHTIKKSSTCNALVKQHQEELKKYDFSVKEEIEKLKEQNTRQTDEYKQCQREIKAEKMKHSNELNRCKREVAQYKKISEEFYIKQTTE